MKRDLLVEAIAIIEAIPKRKISLDHIITPNILCGTVACAIGHLALNPGFSEKTGLEIYAADKATNFRWGTILMVHGYVMPSYAKAGATVLDISVFEAHTLFGMRLNDVTAGFWESDKQVWLKRAYRLLAKYDAIAKRQADEAIVKAASESKASESKASESKASESRASESSESRVIA